MKLVFRLYNAIYTMLYIIIIDCVVKINSVCYTWNPYEISILYVIMIIATEFDKISRITYNNNINE